MNKKQLQRMLELSDIKPINENRRELSSIELVKKGADNKVYGIVRENRKYYIKVSDKTQNLIESDFNYIGGVQNKPKFSYTSFEDATKYLNLMFEDINRTHGSKVSNILESDTELLDEKKFVLKQPKKSTPTPEMDFNFGGGGDSEFGGGDKDNEPSFDFGDDSGDDSGDEGDVAFDFGDDTEDTDDVEDVDLGDEDLEDLDSEDPIKDIQKTTGKLGQKLRDTEDLSSDIQKWVAKSVLSALDLEDMDASDKKDLIRTIKKKKSEDSEDVIDTEDSDTGEDFDMEENYDSYMEDDFEYSYNDMPYDDESLYGSNNGYDSYMSIEPERGLCFDCPADDTDDPTMYDLDMSIGDKGYLNLDPINTNNPYDSYMGDIEVQADRWEDEQDFLDGLCSKCQGSGCSHCAGLGFVEGTTEDNPNLGGDEDFDTDDLLLDDENDNDERARMMADRDIKSHYNNPSFDEMQRGHSLPYDTDFDSNYDSYMGDDTEFTTIEDELGLPPATADMDETDYDHTNIDNETDFVDPLMDMENENYDSYMRDSNDPTMSPGPAPARPAPTKEPNTKPGKPGTDRPARPSKRPFTPPPHIRPGEEPGPKAGRDDMDVSFE